MYYSWIVYRDRERLTDISLQGHNHLRRLVLENDVVAAVDQVCKYYCQVEAPLFQCVTMNQVRPVDFLADFERDCMLAVELLQSVQADSHVVQAAEHDQPLAQAKRCPLLKYERVAKDVLHRDRDASEALAHVAEDIEAVATSLELLEDEANSRVGHSQQLRNVQFTTLHHSEIN